MANILFAYPNKIDGATLSGGSWSSALPLSNLQTSVLAQVARSRDTANASTQIVVNLGRSSGIDAIGLCNHNLSVSARVRVTASSVADFSRVAYQSDWTQVWSSVYESDVLEWEDDNWWSGVLTSEQTGVTRPTFVMVLPARKFGWYWRVEIDDVGNGDGYVEIGRLVLAPAWRPTYNMSYGAGIRWEPTADVSTSLGGTRYFSPRSVARRMRCSLEWLSKAEAIGYGLAMQQQLGRDGQLLVVGDSEDETLLQPMSFLATLASTDEVRFAGPGRWALGLSLDEVI